MSLTWTEYEERRIQSYIRLIYNNKIKIDDVPAKYIDEVRKRIED